MSFKYLSLAVLTCLLLSCSAEQGQVDYSTNGDVRSASLPMAGARGINAVVLDTKLAALLDEAKTIEVQMGQLVLRLNSLKQSIVAYQETPVVAVEPVAAKPMELAKAEPEKLVPEKKVVTPKPIEKVTKAPTKPITSTAKAGVNDVRVGAHSDKTRLVFDINGSTKNSVNFDKEAGILTITFPDTSWSTTTGKNYTLPQLSGYEAKQAGQGTIVALAVKQTSSVDTMVLTNPSRLVVDLMK